MTTAHSAYEELSAGYALNALEPYELQVFLEHLPLCVRCQGDLSGYFWVADEMPYAAASAEPPASLLAGLRQAIGVDARQSLPTPVALVLPLHRRPPRRAALWLSAAAALTLVTSLAETNIGLRADRDSAQQASVRLSSTVSQMVVNRKVPLRGPDGTLRGVALISGDRVSLVLHGLRPNDSATPAYTLIRLNTSGAMEPVGTFTVLDDQMTQTDALPLPGAAGITSLMITLNNPSSAVTSPGRSMIAVGQLS